MSSKTLYLVRHAKSSWNDPTLSDQQRPLNKRGLRNAPEMAARLSDCDTHVDQIICSPANRARTTAQYMASGISYKHQNIQQNDQIYFGGIHAMIDIITQTSSGVNSLMLVGHNPDMTSLFNYLCGNQTYNMPTCAIATIGFDGDWDDVCKNSGKVLDYDYPKRGML